MVTAKFYFECHMDTPTVNFPTVPIGVSRIGMKPNKCLIAGYTDNKDTRELELWAARIQKLLAPEGEMIVDVDTDKYQVSGSDAPTVDKQVQEEKPMTGPKDSEIMKFFEYGHLPVALQEISKTLCQAAIELNEKLPDGEEKYVGLRKLLEAKDCFVRAMYLKESTGN